ncbi:MAG: hypothetical protein IPO18_08105 [bacterium]|nr:hypothetical protein [bacterium]MBP8116265.1 hypothetical protein [Nitrospira sp.]
MVPPLVTALVGPLDRVALAVDIDLVPIDRRPTAVLTPVMARMHPAILRPVRIA